MLSLADQAVPGRRVPGLGRRGRRVGRALEFLDREAVRAELHSPIWHAACTGRPAAMCWSIRPALCRGIARVARRAGDRDPRATRVSPKLERVAGGRRPGHRRG